MRTAEGQADLPGQRREWQERQEARLAAAVDRVALILREQSDLQD